MVEPGRYSMCAVVRKPLRLVGRRGASGERAHLDGTACRGKGALVLKADGIVIEGFEISDIAVASRNGACIRIERDAGDVTIRDIYCHGSENGILGSPKQGTIVIENSIFERNGADGGQAHGLYIDGGSRLMMRESQIISTKGLGHSLKSGAQYTIIEDSLIAGLDGQNSRAIDLYGGGVLEVRRSVIQQGPNADNHDAVAVGMERKRHNPEPHSVLIADSWIVFDQPGRCCSWLFNARKLGPIRAIGNKIVGMTAVSGSFADVETDANTLFESRAAAGLPAYDGTLSSLPQLDLTNDAR